MSSVKICKEIINHLLNKGGEITASNISRSNANQYLLTLQKQGVLAFRWHQRDNKTRCKMYKIKDINKAINYIKNER